MSDNQDDEESWDAWPMILNAKSLQRVANELESHMGDPHSDPLLFQGKFVAVPVLLTLATEIALKAWQCKEQKARPARSHDLLKLFDGLSKDTQTLLAEKFLESSSAQPSIKTTLDFHRKIFEQWRYLYEGGEKKFQIAEINNVLTVIIDTYEEFRYK